MTIEEVDAFVQDLRISGRVYKKMPQEDFRTVVGEEAFQLIQDRDALQRAEEDAQKSAKLERLLESAAPLAAERERQIQEIAATFTGAVSWRQLAILCILPDVAAVVRGVKKDSARAQLQRHRQVLREEGWAFPSEDIGGRITIMAAIPPPMTGGDEAVTDEGIGDEGCYRPNWRGIRRSVSEAEHARFVRELAEAQQKSTWGIRLPASSR